MTSLIQGDALHVLKAVPDDIADIILCSTPYFQQRDYGVTGQIGQEETVPEYLERLWATFDEARRVLKPRGTCWVNIGDKYQKKHMQLIPERFAAGMKERHWVPRGLITWHKKNAKPESVKSRFASDSEPIYMFAKGENHFFRKQFEPYSAQSLQRFEGFRRNGERVDPAILQGTVKNLRVPGQQPNGMHIARALGHGRDVFDPRGRTMRSVWTLPVARCMTEHFAVWPEELVKRILLAGCPSGGIVLDPFVGVGTSMIVAEALGYVGIGIDINGSYLEMARKGILEARAKRAKSPLEDASAT
jgi:site-specific DNA-methyltransferase (adenine-specific)